jgi:hypothetical protein
MKCASAAVTAIRPQPIASAEALRQALERCGWDCGWYLRAFYIGVRNDGPLNGDAPLNMTVDSKPVPGNLLALHDDGEAHRVQVALKNSGSQ